MYVYKKTQNWLNNPGDRFETQIWFTAHTIANLQHYSFSTKHLSKKMPQDAEKLTLAIEKVKSDILREVNDILPRRVGVLAVNLFRQNFRNAGFMDGTNHPWKTTRRQLGKGKDSKYTPLTSRRNHLMMSTT